ncbi:MAG: hypothetical protein RJA44_1107 [Pseudomonadota bacterium]
MRRLVLWPALLAGSLLLGGCMTPPKPYDYSAFRAAKPATLLVLPPVNLSPDIKATPSVWSHATQPLAEGGYYVLPITLVDETLRQNGVQTAAEAQDIPAAKLREVFGADAAVYIKVLRYGSSYTVLNSESRVDVEGRIVDLRSGELLWEGKGSASSAEQSQQSQGGLAGLLVAAIVKQIISNATDASHNYAGMAQSRMLGVPRFNGVLPGPRSPLYGQPAAQQ